MKTNNKLKLIGLAAAFSLAPFMSTAQSDGFFNDWYDSGSRNENSTGGGINDFDIEGENNNTEPLGSGLLILTAAGAGYALVKREKLKEKREKF